MWILKGSLAGLLLFALFNVFYFRARVFPNGLEQNKAIALSSLRGLTVQQPMYWAVLALMVATACLCMRMLQTRVG
jgi:ABC-type branched-subunit amino acid transport system permease subunit